ncbi:hypothetical protein DOTSEDRAFT_53679 [Dothistroma septosporum NZE10]|uniref:Secreted protein n=1 Tax=Dothistroma septosporum (strain NZE10 / CBS 128990) TaxID=675120 RepID=N1PMJ6_DOTSN|nr:hypothetical protein DOTSEDRAFT_53679 [Dothistroma septosporum NZE10]
MKFSTTTVSLLALFSFVSADANAIPNAEAGPDKLSDAIFAAAKARQSAALHPNLDAFGAIGQAEPKPTVPKLAGLGIIGVGDGQTNWRQQCRKKNPKLEVVIAKFCESGHGGKGGVTVPNSYPQGGMCTARDPNWIGTGVGYGFDPKQNHWCVKIGSGKSCEAYNIPKDTCMGKLFQVCAKGDDSGKGAASENGGCQVYRTGKINYTNNVGAVAKNPFSKGSTSSGTY